MNTRHLLSSEEIAVKLQELTTGLIYQSESDYPVEVVHYEAALPDTFTEKELLNLIGSAPEMPVEVTDSTFFFRNVMSPDIAIPKADNTAEQITALQAFCEEYIKNMKFYRIGSRTFTALLLGISLEGQLLGLKTTIIQT